MLHSSTGKKVPRERNKKHFFARFFLLHVDIKLEFQLVSSKERFNCIKMSKRVTLLIKCILWSWERIKINNFIFARLIQFNFIRRVKKIKSYCITRLHTSP